MQLFFSYCEDILKERAGLQKCFIFHGHLTEYPQQRPAHAATQAGHCPAPGGPDTLQSSWPCRTLLKKHFCLTLKTSVIYETLFHFLKFISEFFLSPTPFNSPLV